MSPVVVIVGVVLWLLIVAVVWSLCVAAARADEEFERGRRDR